MSIQLPWLDGSSSSSLVHWSLMIFDPRHDITTFSWWFFFDFPFLYPSLKLTAKAPENGCLEYKPFLLGFSLFSGRLTLVSGRVSLLNLPEKKGNTQRNGNSWQFPWLDEAFQMWASWMPFHRWDATRFWAAKKASKHFSQRLPCIVCDDHPQEMHHPSECRT